jgi:hypothetical protein
VARRGSSPLAPLAGRNYSRGRGRGGDRAPCSAIRLPMNREWLRGINPCVRQWIDCLTISLCGFSLGMHPISADETTYKQRQRLEQQHEATRSAMIHAAKVVLRGKRPLWRHGVDPPVIGIPEWLGAQHRGGENCGSSLLERRGTSLRQRSSGAGPYTYWPQGRQYQRPYCDTQLVGRPQREQYGA